MIRTILLISVLLLSACAGPSATQPASAPTQAGAPTSAAAPSPAAPAAAPGIHPGAVVVDDSFVTIYGEFENTGQRWLHNIQIEATYYDAAGAEIYRVSVPTEILFAGPGERVPFYLVTSKERMSGAYANFSLAVSSIENDQPGSRLETTLSDQGVSYGVGEVTGTVRHTGQGSCGYPTVAVAYYDAAGKVLAVSSNYLETLSPGQEAAFKLLTPMQSAEYSQVKAWAACREIDGTPVP